MAVRDRKTADTKCVSFRSVYLCATKSNVVGHPDNVYTAIEFGKMPVNADEDPLDVSGMEVRYIWYDSHEKRRDRNDPALVSVISFESCSKQPHERGTVYRYHLVAQEVVNPEHPYGQWLRKQSIQGEIGDDVGIIEVTLEILLGLLTAEELHAYRRLGLPVQATDTVLLNHGFTGIESHRVSDLTLDRLTEAVALIGEWVADAPNKVRKRRQLYQELSAAERRRQEDKQKADAALAPVSAKFEDWKQRRIEAETALAAAIRVLDELRTKYRQDVEALEAEVRTAQQALSSQWEKFKQLERSTLGVAQKIGGENPSVTNIARAAFQARDEHKQMIPEVEALERALPGKLDKLGRIFRGEERRKEGAVTNAEQQLRRAKPEGQPLEKELARLTKRCGNADEALARVKQQLAVFE